ncbi:MAG: DNA alkylation repair protein [Planctomycetia bacterium]|nr:DNA alkylation repair protein [Planctomycetia bacterium]
MKLADALKKLKSLGHASVRAHNTKFGATGEQFGVKMGDIRALAKTIKTDHTLALALWKTGNVDAQFLAVLVMVPKNLSADELDALVRTTSFAHVADWFSSYVLKEHPERESLRVKWMASDHPWAARAGWGLTSTRVAKDPKGLDLKALLDRIEAEMGSAPAATQWTMNAVLANIGIHHPKLRKRALAIGEKLGVYRDYPCSKGCTSPFAPIWIAEMVRRQEG